MPEAEPLACVEELVRIGFYRAPNRHAILGRTIPSGWECVEIIIGGKVWFESDGIDREYGEGTMFWHIGGEETVRRNVTDDPYRCLVMEFRMKTPVPPRRFPRITVLREPRIAARLTEEWLGIDLRDPLDMRTFCQYAYGRLCWEAHSALTRRPGVPANLSVSRPAALQRILEHIRLHFAEDLMLADLARIGGISESGVHLLFRKHLQQSPHRHLLCVRIQEARRLLANSDLTIKEIAGACGFMSTENFCRNFRRENGVSAGEYRQKTRTEMLEL